jgi:hypothetical protein
MDSRLLFGKTGEFLLVFSLECPTTMVGFEDGDSKSENRGESSNNAGSSTGAAGDGITNGFVVVSARFAASGFAWEAACVLAEEVWVFFCRTEMDVGV